MAAIAENVATHVTKSLADKAMQELKYLCCYKSYVDDFEEEKTSLRTRRGTVLKDIEEAKDKNENQIENEVELWLDRANGLIQEDTKGKKKWFGLIPNCFWQYKRGKELEGKKQRIKQMIDESKTFARVARSTGLPSIGFYSSSNFIHLDDRKFTSKKLKEALKDDNKFMIGLYGLGGTGKTTMALQVGKEVEESKVFDKVVFSVVSNDPNLKSIQDNIAKHLNLPLDDKMNESEQAKQLWKRISEGDKKVLIILDDLWKKLPIREIGIPLGRHGKGYCAILLTARNWKVCVDTGCDETIELRVLNENDAINLFLHYAGLSNTNDSSNGFKDVATNIVKECGRLPVAIVAMARAMKSRPLTEWKQGLERLRNTKSMHGVSEDLKEAYNSLRLSYDYLENEKAQKLFRLCSLFPEDYEIPIELLTRIAIGLGLCGEVDIYSTSRSNFTPIKNLLIDSSLLLKAENEVVKMHDLVREVALWIENQLAMEPRTMFMENTQHTSPSHFDGRKLEAFLLWMSNNDDYIVPYHIFEGMENLKFLALISRSDAARLKRFGLKPVASIIDVRTSSLINVRTLAIKGFELGDIHFLGNLKSLESLELRQCSMTEFPNNIREIKRLRLLEMVGCAIERNDPFQVIGSCSQLQELYYVLNDLDKDAYKSSAQIKTLPKLERYHIKAAPHSGYSGDEVDYSISRCFDSYSDLRVNFSDEIFKLLLEKVEVLKLYGKFDNRGWTNIVPDILHVEHESMEDHLTTLCLNSMNGLKCLINTKSLQSGVAIFSKLVELRLYSMNVIELCCGSYPVNFLKHLEKLNLSWCQQMEGLLFDGKLELCYLKSIYLYHCSMTCLFDPFTSQSLKQLETLQIEECSELKYIVGKPMEDHDPNQKSHDSVFPELKDLQVKSCPELEFIFPICFYENLPSLGKMEIVDCKKLEYIFGRYPEERDLHQMGGDAILQSLEELKILKVSNFINIYAECYLPVQKSSPSTKVEDCNSTLPRGRRCCFWPKSNASTAYHPSASTNQNTQALKVNYVINRAHGLFIPPLYPYTHLRRMEISELSGLKSLFTLSSVSSLKLLEILKVKYCHTLEHIVIIDKEDGLEQMNVNCFFPNLREVEVSFCDHLEYIFPALYSKDLKDLQSMFIFRAETLTHVFGKCGDDKNHNVGIPNMVSIYARMLTRVFGKCDTDQNHNVKVDLNLPALKQLHLFYTPSVVSICAENYSMKALYLEDISLEGCTQLPLETFMDLLVIGLKRQEDLSSTKVLSFQNLSKLTINGCKQLKFILCASTSRRLQKLRELKVSECEALVSIIEDEENDKNPMASNQGCFPELRRIEVRDCKSMKYLFSISCNKLPRLLYVSIEGTPQLREAFRRKHGEGQKLAMKDVFPKLFAMRLVNLPTLHNICESIDFHAVELRRVRECPAISLTSANDSYYELEELSVDEDDDVSHRADIIHSLSLEALGDPTETDEDDDYIPPNWSEIFSISSPKKPQIETSAAQSEQSANESANKIVEEKLSTTPSSNSDTNLKTTLGEGPSSKNYGKASSSKELCGKESMGDDQQALGEKRSSNNEAPQRVEEPTNEFSCKETSNKIALTIPSSIATGMTSSQPQIATSTTQVEMESGSSTVTDQSAQVKTMVRQEISTNEEETKSFFDKETKSDRKKSQIFEEHDLMRLFQIIKKGAHMEVETHYVTKLIADLQHNEEVSKALADLEVLLKMSLNEIACSEESRLRLHNALNTLSSHCSGDGASSQGLQSIVHSLQQEIQTVLSSFSHAYATIDTFTKLEHKKKLMIEQYSQWEKDAETLLADLNNTKNSIAEAQLNEAKLKKQISKLQAELHSKEKEIEECKTKLLFLQEQEKKSVSTTTGFTMEFLAMEKERSLVEDQKKARQQLENMDAKWSSCLYNLKKTMMLLGVHLKQKL